MNFFMNYSSSGEPDLNRDRDFWWVDLGIPLEKPPGSPESDR